MTKSPTLDMGNPTYDIYGKIIGFSPTASTKSPTLEPIKKKCICNYPHLPTTKCPVHDYPKSQPIEECGVTDHDFKHLKRFGRADWRCPKCGKNVMLLLVFAQQAGVDLTK